jgi:hypothetical protein
VDDHVEGLEVHVRVLRVEQRDQIRADRARERRQVVRAVDRGSVEDVMRAGRDHDPDPGVDQPLQLGRRPLDRAAWLDIRVEQVARDQDEVDLLGEGKVDRCHEGRELALTLCRGSVAEVRVPRPEMDVGRVQQSQHAL